MIVIVGVGLGVVGGGGSVLEGFIRCGVGVGEGTVGVGVAVGVGVKVTETVGVGEGVTVRVGVGRVEAVTEGMGVGETGVAEKVGEGWIGVGVASRPHPTAMISATSPDTINSRGYRLLFNLSFLTD